ncbi:unnamed protein product [Lepidochelys olivacea]
MLDFHHLDSVYDEVANVEVDFRLNPDMSRLSWSRMKYQNEVAKEAADALSSLYGTKYKYGQIAQIIFGDVRADSDPLLPGIVKTLPVMFCESPH